MKEYKVGYIAGVFDLFHIGHLNLLRSAKEKCEYLIVGVLTDELTSHFKRRPPVIPHAERMVIVEAIRYVDRVVSVSFDNIDKMEAWKLYRYDCLFSGDDYANEPHWTKAKEQLNKVGSDLQFFPYTKSTSSTQIRESISK